MTQARLLAELQQEGYLQTPAVKSAFKKVDRADFVPEELRSEAYANCPLPIGHGQTISQPLTVVFMLELLQVREGDVVLDVGSGSGWTTAILAKLVGKRGCVFGVERVPELIKFGQDNLVKYHLPQAQIIAAGKWLGLPDEGPFDRILVSAEAEKLPQPLLKQLKAGGRMVIPIKGSLWQVDKQKNGEIATEVFPGFVFVPLHVG